MTCTLTSWPPMTITIIACTLTRWPPSSGNTVNFNSFPIREEIRFDLIRRALQSATVHPSVVCISVLVLVVDRLVRVLFWYAAVDCAWTYYYVTSFLITWPPFPSPLLILTLTLILSLSLYPLLLCYYHPFTPLTTIILSFVLLFFYADTLNHTEAVDHWRPADQPGNTPTHPHLIQ